MKTLILTAALAVSAALTTAQQSAPSNSVNADEKQSAVEVAVLQRNTDEVTLLMKKEPRETVKIKIYEGSMLLHAMRVKKEATANITYDISQFPDGRYTLEVVKDREVVYKTNIRKGSEPLADNK